VVSLWRKRHILKGGIIICGKFDNVQGIPIVKDVKFYGQPIGSFGTGFYVQSNNEKRAFIITAGHCVVDADGNTIFDDYVNELRVVFGFQLEKKEIPSPWKIDEDQIYEISGIVEAKYDKHFDYAILELKRVPPNEHFPPLTISFPKIEIQDDVYTIGHPCGLPLKLARGAKVQKIYEKYFTSDLDTYHGNSGSPVLLVKEDNHLLSGILIKGNDDWVIENNMARPFQVGSIPNVSLMTDKMQESTSQVSTNSVATGEMIFNLSCIKSLLKELNLIVDTAVDSKTEATDIKKDTNPSDQPVNV